MTSFGRGRGWVVIQNQDQILRRPGSASNIVRDITDKIINYDIREHILPQLIEEIVDLMTSTFDKSNLKDTCDTLWKQAIQQDSLTTKIAVLFSNNKILLIEDNNKETIRSRFLRFLQESYMSREKNKVEDTKVFANVVLLHAEVYYRMRLNDGNRLQILAEPLIHYLEDLLQDNSKSNNYFIMIQLLRSGKDLHAACPERLDSLMMTIRQMLIQDKNYNLINRTVLLLMVELANNNYEITNTQVKHFYQSNIKTISFEHPFSREEIKVVAEAKTENGNQLQKMDNNQRFVREEITNDTSEEGNCSKSTNVPRAIRGTGALNKDKSKYGNISTKLNSSKLTPPRQKNKGWDHDDRFHKDYA